MGHVRSPLWIITLGTVACAGGCVGPGLLTDGSSVSVGTHSRGGLRNATRLPFRGEGYVIPRRWQERGRSYGTDELVELLVRSARRVNRAFRNSQLGVADLSLPAGGPTPQHRSHYSGRDVDLLFYSTNLAGKPLPPREMLHYDSLGMQTLPDSQPVGKECSTQSPPPDAKDRGPTLRKFDVARNWALVKALVTDYNVSVQWIFIGRPLARLILRHARALKEPGFIITRAAMVLHQPSDAQSHMDHMHVRIFCSVADRRQGCIDRGPPRWFKKNIKYLDAPLPPPSLPIDLALLPLGHMRLSGIL